MSRYLTLDELDNVTHLGIPVSWIGEEGDALAFTDDPAAGEAAILEMARVDLGGDCTVAGDVKAHWMRFHTPEGYSSDEWQADRCEEGDEGAMRVVRATWVSSLADLEASA